MGETQTTPSSHLYMEYDELLRFYEGFEAACKQFMGFKDTRFFVITYSAIGITALVGFYLFFNKKLKMHPYPLYALEIITCAAYYQSFMNLVLFHTIT